MIEAVYICLALLVGVGTAVQVGMVGSLGRQTGPTEATWISLLATLTGVSIVLGARSLREGPSLSAPLTSPIVFLGVAVSAAVALGISLKGLSPVLGLAGLFGFAYLSCTAFLVPRIGIALFASAVTAGTLIGSVGLDQVGAFGADVHRVSLIRIGGVLTLLLGLVLVRGGLR